MFAIEITKANLGQIWERFEAPEPDKFDYGLWLHTTEPYYYVSGYVGHSGTPQPFAILPKHQLDKYFEYDPVKIQNDWDQIVRK